MKVLHLITKSNWGGAQRCVYSLAVDAKAAGLDVAVALGGNGPLAEKLTEAGVRVISIPSLGRDVDARGDFAAAGDVWRILGEERPDVLHLHSSKAGGIGALLGRLRRVPAVIFTAHGWAFNESRPEWQRFLIRLLHAATVLLAHKTIAVASSIPRQLGWGGILGRRFVLIPNGIDFPKLLPREAARAALAAQSPSAGAIFARENVPVIGTIAELHRIKGLDVLVEAAADLRRRLPALNFGIVVLGEGSERAALGALIGERGLGDRFALPGFIQDAPEHLAAFDALAMPSRSEAMPLALLEAGSAGLPVVASRVGGIPDVIENLETGLLISPDRPRELAEALRRLIEDAALREKLGAALRARVLDRFPRQKMSTATIEIYGRIAARQV